MNDIAERLNQLSPEKRTLLMRQVQERMRYGTRTIQPRANQHEYPIGFAQQRMWFLEQMQPEVALYNITTSIEIRRLQAADEVVNALAICLNEILRRHEVLRARFSFDAGNLVQLIDPSAAIDIPYTDLQALAITERRKAAKQLAQAELQRRFDMTHDRLLRTHLLQLAPDWFVLVLTVHHSVFDAWSVGLLVQEIEAIFAAMAAGTTITRPPLAIQYADFAAWQHQSLQGALLEQQLNYWKQQLRGPLPILDLPTDYPRPALRTVNGAQQAFTIPAPITAGLRALSQRYEATMFMTLLAVWGVLLYRYGGNDDLLIGTPIANRHHRELEPLIGCFVNTLVLRIDLAGNPRFDTLLAQVSQMALAAYTHQDLPFEVLVDALHVERDISRTPLFQVLFALQNTPLGRATGEINILSDMVSPAKFDLTLTMSDATAELQGVLEYNTDLFAPGTIERMLGHFATLLAAVVAQPTTSIDMLPLLTPRERRQILDEWNATARPYPDNVCIHQLFEAQVLKQADRPAIVTESGRLEYQQLNQRANWVAQQLLERESGSKTMIGVFCSRSIDLVVALLGVLKSGSAYVPLDPTYPAARLARMIVDAKINILVTQEHLIAQIQAYLPANIQLVYVDHQEPTAEPILNPACRASPDDPAYIIYTSGSTGQPKGVQLAHRGLVNLIQEQISWFELTPTSRVLQMASLSFDASVSEIFTTLIAGATLYLPPPTTEEGGLDVVALLERYQISVVTLSPALLAVLPPTELPALATIIVAGERCSAEIIATWGGKRRMINAYGPTETTVCATMHMCDPLLPTDPPIGRPIGNVQTYLLDQQLQPVPIGVTGELYIGGVGVAQGYLNRPELNATKFLPNPFAAGTIYRTGDLGRYLPDGTIAYLGRSDDQLKVRGFRIEVGEIEHELSRQPGVTGAVVVAQADPVVGLRLVGYITIQTGSVAETVIANSLTGLRRELPSYMLPSTLIVLPEFPLTLNKKLDRRSLALRPLTFGSELVGVRRAPETELERTLAQVWSDVLQHSAISTHDNFFDIGGNSLSMIKVLTQLNQVLQRELNISTLFRFPTISSLAQHLHTGDVKQTTKLQTNQRQGAQQREALKRQKRRGQG